MFLVFLDLININYDISHDLDAKSKRLNAILQKEI